LTFGSPQARTFVSASFRESMAHNPSGTRNKHRAMGPKQVRRELSESLHLQRPELLCIVQMACNCNQRPHSHSPDSVAMRRPCASVDNVVSFPWRPEHWAPTWGDEHISKVDPRGDRGGEAEACPGNGIWIAGRQRPATPCRRAIW
jgi:hypothetical protein